MLRVLLSIVVRRAGDTEPIEAIEAIVDGRRARRERGRVAVIDAVIDLVLGGFAPPSTDQIAARAGVSTASLFRYFDSLDELRHEAIEHYFGRFAHVFELPGIGDGSLPERIDRFVAAKLTQYETTAPMARLARLRAADVEELATTLHRLRLTHADQIRLHFAAELEAMTATGRADTVDVLATMTSYESWDQLTNDHRRDRDRIERVWRAAISRLLG